MSGNPYTPPGADVRDPTSEQPVPERPRQVVHAVRMLWISLAMSIPVSIREFQDATADVNSSFLLYFILALYAISALINLFVYRGSNQARILLLVFNVLNILSVAIAMDEILEYQTGDLVAMGTSMCLDLVALVLIFTRPGALWFRRGRRWRVPS